MLSGAGSGCLHLSTMRENLIRTFIDPEFSITIFHHETLIPTRIPETGWLERGQLGIFPILEQLHGF